MQMFFYADDETCNRSITKLVSVNGANNYWQTLVLNSGQVSQLSPSDPVACANSSGDSIKEVEVRIASSFGNKLTGYFDLDAVQLLDANSGSQLINKEIGSFSAPYVDNLTGGDYAANVIDRLGGIGWWGSSSHHLTGGFAFADSKSFAEAFFFGRTLGESTYLAKLAMSGIVYGDPLYSPSAAKIFIEDKKIYLADSSEGDSRLFGGYTVINSIPETAEAELKINVFHGRANTSLTRWQVSTCSAASQRECDSNNLWSQFAAGTGAVENHVLLTNLNALNGDFSRNHTVFIRLHVWNPQEEEQALYSYGAINFRAQAYLKDFISEAKISSTIWDLGETDIELAEERSVPYTIFESMGINRVTLKESFTSSLKGFSFRVKGANRAEYQTEILSGGEQDEVVLSITPALLEPERLLIEFNKADIKLSIRFDAIPGNFAEPNNILDDTDMYAFSRVQSLLKRFSPDADQTFARIDFNLDGILDSLDADVLQSWIDRGLVLPSETQCQDSLDNDGDGNIDEQDLGCASYLDNDEGDEPDLCVVGIDTNNDGVTDLCDEDDDGDGILDKNDCAPLDVELFQARAYLDTDNDSIADSLQMVDTSCFGNDGLVGFTLVANGPDNCPVHANTDQKDFDGDGKGDICDLDDDNDGLSDEFEATLGTNPRSSDSDNDGVSDGTEQQEGTNPLDSGSGILRYGNKVCVEWNGFVHFLSQIFELRNTSEVPIRVQVTLFVIETEPQGSFDLVLNPGMQFDTIVNDLEGFIPDSFGLVCAKVLDGPANSIGGQLVTYRFNATSYDLAYKSELLPPRSGTQYLTYNTYHPSSNPADWGNFVANWVQIINEQPETQTGVLRSYDTEGHEIRTVSVTLKPNQRRDIDLHSVGRFETGLVSWEPDSISAKFRVRQNRYYYGPAGLSDLVGAISLPARLGTGEKLLAPFNTKNKTVALEISNTSSEPIEVITNVRNSSGNKTEKQPPLLTIPKFGTRGACAQ